MKTRTGDDGAVRAPTTGAPAAETAASGARLAVGPVVHAAPDPATTALVLIDVQRHVLDPAKHPPRSEFYRRAETVVLPTLARLLDALRSRGVEIVHTVIESLTADGRDRGLDYKLSGFDIARGAPGAEIDPAVVPAGDEIVLPKTSACLFNSTNAAWLLRNMGVTDLVCAGFLTDQCVEQTVKRGCSEGFRAWCVTDGCAADTDLAHERALGRIGEFGALVACDELVALLDAESADRPALSAADPAPR